MKKTIVFAIVLLSIFLMYRFPDAMLSPGKLVEGHQSMNNSCTSCHLPFWGIVNEKCVACHKLADIGRDTLHPNDTMAFNKKILFHARLEKQQCTSCHTDHKGIKPANVSMVFDHAVLKGTSATNCNNCHNKPMDKTHEQISNSCNSCHNTQGWKSGVVFNHEMIKGSDKNNCIACHHKPEGSLHNQLSTSCGDCHNTQGWKTGVVFNHQMIKGADITNCVSCHQKPTDNYHQLIKDNCSKCHSSSQWKPSTFDHSAYFRLDENHNASCITCHTTNNYSIYSCYGCHEHSPNKIQEKHIKHGISNYTNCASCHKSGSEHEGGEHGKSEGKEEDD